MRVLLIALFLGALALDNGLGRTPQMGYVFHFLF